VENKVLFFVSVRVFAFVPVRGSGEAGFRIGLIQFSKNFPLRGAREPKITPSVFHCQLSIVHFYLIRIGDEV
jgi:hypothetical protein